jgi:hypothetical protein
VTCSEHFPTTSGSDYIQDDQGQNIQTHNEWHHQSPWSFGRINSTNIFYYFLDCMGHVHPLIHYYYCLSFLYSMFHYLYTVLSEIPSPITLNLIPTKSFILLLILIFYLLT